MTLRRIANIIRSTSRTTQVVARLGGDEFALLLPETDLEAARFDEPPDNVDAIVTEAVQLMYRRRRGERRACRAR
ncbi:MAG: diguanylate cyclase [Myxococcaceae bacterium]|nr:diguanylate cyclase [Myxococcaceae bacterium]